MAGVEFPRNPFTDMIEEVAERNRSGGGLSGLGVSSAVPTPTARSADLGREVTELPPLTEEEHAELNRLAAAAGVKDDRIGTAEPQGAYPSLEAAIAAGASVPQPVRYDAIQRVPLTFDGDRQTATEFLSRRDASRLPDFRRVEVIDLQRNVVRVDGMEFPITREEALDFKQFVVDTARSAIMSRLEEAVLLFAAPETAEVTSGEGAAQGEVQDVQRQPDGGGAEPPV